MTYVYDPEENFIHATVDGVVTVDEMMHYCKSVLSDKRIQPGFIEVVNFETATDLKIFFQQMRPFRNIWELYLQAGCAATLFYTPTDLSFGIIRMLQSMIGPELFEEQVPFELYRTKEELERKIEEVKEIRDSELSGTN